MSDEKEKEKSDVKIKESKELYDEDDPRLERTNPLYKKFFQGEKDIPKKDQKKRE